MNSLSTLVFCAAWLVATAFAVPGVLNHNGRILNGQEVSPHNSSFMLQIVQLADGMEQHFCGGVILNSRWVLTAAQCLDNVADIILIAGQHDRSVVEPWEQRRLAERIIVHEEYCGLTCSNFDIALVFVNQPFAFDNFVQPIQLPGFQQIPNNYLQVLGWGSTLTTNDIALSYRLLYNYQPVYNLGTCEGIHGSKLNISNNNLCTGPVDGSAAACVGDQGGPLVDFDDNGQPIVVGIISYIPFPCGRSFQPNVNVRVSAFVDWIFRSVGLIDK